MITSIISLVMFSILAVTMLVCIMTWKKSDTQYLVKMLKKKTNRKQ